MGGAGVKAAAVQVCVPLSGGRDYTIHIGSGLLSCAGGLIEAAARSRRAAIITQPRIAKAWAPLLVRSLGEAGYADVPVITFPDGERYKSLATVTRLCDRLYNLSPAADRKMLIIALGGGVVGDVAGFVASIYLRGLDYVQVPTTLLAMVDSSVGGKTGVDFHEGKNLVGAFHQPRAVLIDTDVLGTLPTRERRAGVAEVIKYGVISDPALLDFVTACGDQGAQAPEAIAHIVRRSCEIKADVVSQDEFETTGLRAILNYGHTIGHALEATTRYRRFRHGEAVAIGMMVAAHIGEVQSITPPQVGETIRAALAAHRLPSAIPEDIAPDDLLPLLARDKKAEGGRANFVLAKRLGEVHLFNNVSEAVVREGLLRAYAQPDGGAVA
jgi:3-dehydroquinate synthase